MLNVEAYLQELDTYARLDESERESLVRAVVARHPLAAGRLARPHLGVAARLGLKHRPSWVPEADAIQEAFGELVAMLREDPLRDPSTDDLERRVQGRFQRIESGGPR
jgi:hypothetical protein